MRPLLSGAAPLVETLNDLLRLDRDAEEAYRIAIDAVASDEVRGVLVRCHQDHRRHIADLSRLIRRHGGRPLDATRFRPGAFAWGVRAVAGVGGDREILSALWANEEQARDAYRRAASGPIPPAAAGLLGRHAEDEARHFEAVGAELRAAIDALAEGEWEPAPRRRAVAAE